MSLEQILAAISRATGRKLPARPAAGKTTGLAGVGAESAAQSASFCGWQADIPALRELHPQLMTFDTWLARQGKVLIEQLLDQSKTV